MRQHRKSPTFLPPYRRPVLLFRWTKIHSLRNQLLVLLQNLYAHSTHWICRLVAYFWQNVLLILMNAGNQTRPISVRHLTWPDLLNLLISTLLMEINWVSWNTLLNSFFDPKLSCVGVNLLVLTWLILTDYNSLGRINKIIILECDFSDLILKTIILIIINLKSTTSVILAPFTSLL